MAHCEKCPPTTYQCNGFESHALRRAVFAPGSRSVLLRRVAPGRARLLPDLVDDALLDVPAPAGQRTRFRDLLAHPSIHYELPQFTLRTTFFLFLPCELPKTPLDTLRAA